MLKTASVMVSMSVLILGLSAGVFGQWHPEIDKVRVQKSGIKTKSVKGKISSSSRSTGRRIHKPLRVGPSQPLGMNKADLTEQLSIKSPRDVASGQSTGKTANPNIKAKTKKPLGWSLGASNPTSVGSSGVKSKRRVKKPFRPNPTGDGTTQHFRSKGRRQHKP